MKTATIARFVLGASAIFAAAGLVGCGAEQGSEDPSAVGSTSEALTATPVKLTGLDDPTDLTAMNGHERKFASSCKMKDANGIEYFVIAGGFDATPTALSSILLAPANGAFVKQTATLSVARGDGKMIAVSDTECVFVGGSTAPQAATAKTTVDVLTLVAGPAIAVNAGGTPKVLQQARSNHQLSTCTDANGLHVVAFGGLAGTAQDSVEVSAPIANITTTNWVKTAAVLSTGRYNFGLAKEPTSNHYIAAAGVSGANAHDSTFDLITMSSSCVPSNVAFGSALGIGLEGNVAFPTAANTFQVNAGRTLVGGVETLYTTGRQVTVTNWTTGAATVAAGNALAAGAYRPVLVDTDPTNHVKVALVGGSNAAISAPITTVEQFTGAWAAAATGLNPGMYGGVAEYFPNTAPKNAGTPNGILISATGTDFATPLPLTVEAWK